jgi:transposase
VEIWLGLEMCDHRAYGEQQSHARAYQVTCSDGLEWRDAPEDFPETRYGHNRNRRFMEFSVFYPSLRAMVSCM